MSTRDVTRLRLCSQRLVGAGFRTPGDVVQWLVAVQAQDYAAAKWGIGLRMSAATDNDVEQS